MTSPPKADDRADDWADDRDDDPAGELVCLGVITGAIGVRGEVRVKTFTETIEGIAAYGALTGEPGGARLEISALRPAKGGAAVRLAGVEDRDAALAMKGVQLCVPRSALGEADQGDEDTFFHVDLVGLEARDQAGATIGTVTAVHDFGAGDILEIVSPGTGAGGGKTEMVTFLKETVPVVDLKAGYLVVAPQEMVGDEE